MGKQIKLSVPGFKQLQLMDKFVGLLCLIPCSKFQVLSAHRQVLNSAVPPVKGLEVISTGLGQSTPHFNKK